MDTQSCWHEHRTEAGGVISCDDCPMILYTSEGDKVRMTEEFRAQTWDLLRNVQSSPLSSSEWDEVYKGSWGGKLSQRFIVSLDPEDPAIREITEMVGLMPDTEYSIGYHTEASLDDLALWSGRCLAYHPESLTRWMVTIPTPDGIELITADMGNGPHAEQLAFFYSNAPAAMRYLLAKLEKLQSLPSSLQAWLIDRFDAGEFIDTVLKERQRQQEVWGDQVHPDGTGSPSQQSTAHMAKMACDQASARGDVTWCQILTEEVAEAFAEHDRTKLKQELLEAAAVILNWVTALDRKGPDDY